MASTALFVGAFAVVGAAILLAAHAATGDAAFILAPQSGTISGNASVVSDGTAVGGQAVRFGPDSGSGGGTGTGTGTGGGGSTGSTAAAGCSLNSVVAPCVNATSGNGASGWGTPVFDDEFDGTSLNTTDWSTKIEEGDPYENNVQVSSSNVSVSGGNLIITLSSSNSGANVTSDPAQGMKGFQFGAGYFVEGRVYFPGSGANNLYNWPAFWTVGNNWPSAGEIDVAEVGNGPLTTSYHCSGGSQSSGYQCDTASPGGTWANDWHIYSVDRESGKAYVYWDGKLVKTYSTSDGGANEHIVINIGNSTGPNCSCGGPSTYGASSQVKVDYVRVWKKQ